MKIIPAIDIIDGRCVRLEKGDYAKKKVYNDDPVEVAKSFEELGFRHLHVVDLDGARLGDISNWKTLRAICSETNLSVDFGGGITAKEDVSRLFETGVAKVNIGSMAVRKRDTVIELMKEFPDKIILSADVRNDQIAVNGWKLTTSMHINDFLNQFIMEDFNPYVTCTDIKKDGMLLGPSTALYQKILDSFPGIKLIASGGVGSVQDVEDLIPLNLEGVIIGKAIYEGKFDAIDLIKYVN